MLQQELALQTAVEAFLATRPFYPCLVLAHPEIARLRQTCDWLTSLYHWPKLSIGCLLSEGLLSVSSISRPSESTRVFMEALQRLAPGPVLCTDVDLLFEPSLALDALRVFRETSRVVPLVVLWPGAFTGRQLAYAQPVHAHYRVWRRTDLSDDCIVNI